MSFSKMIFSGLFMFALVMPVAAVAQGYVEVDKGSHKYNRLIEGPLADRIVWAFDDPGDDSNPLGLLLETLRPARKIVWASYKPTHPDLVDLLNGHKRAWGIYDENYCGDCDDAFGGNKKVTAVALGIYSSRSRRKWLVMHHKFAAIDYSKNKPSGSEAVIAGSFNWNEKAAERNYEDIVRINSRKIAGAFWREYKRIKGKHAGNPGPVSDGDIEVAFNEHCAPLLARYIDAAQKSVHVAVWTISPSSSRKPNPVYDALVSAMERGVKVRILTDARKARKRDYGDLDVIRAEMPSRKTHLHHKFAVIDGKTVITGSYNYVTKALSGNYENVVAINSPAMATSYSAWWETVRAALQ